MKLTRLFQERALHVHDHMTLDPLTVHRLKSVLRVGKDEPLLLFNGDGFEYHSIITVMKRDLIQVKITEKTRKNLESPLSIHLGQVISKGEKMDFVIQKATELGVQIITPLFSERSVVHLKEERMAKKQEHWQKIAIHAAEQCGRTVVPQLQKPMKLEEWVYQQQASLGIVLDPEAKQHLNQIDIPRQAVSVLIGPEGGLTERELDFAILKKFTAIQLGPRILRTETAALTVLSILQFKNGDFNGA